MTSLYTVTARTLADLRQHVAFEELAVIDMLIDRLADEYFEANPSFSVATWYSATRYRYDRTTQD